ncbi:MAG: coenzyme synthetase-like protein [Rhodospirillaceae bacterium]|nr:MAG: coenzyme synthetase-like protein [Rhodospirillaceae bacterium]
MLVSYRLKQAIDLGVAFVVSKMLATHDRWSPVRVRSEQLRRFRRLLSFAASNSPFYRDLYRGIRLDEVEWPSQLPVIDKPRLMDSFDDVVTDRRLKKTEIEAHLHRIRRDDYYLGEYRVITTAGTSGFRGTFVFNRREWATELANALRWQHMIGVQPRLPRRVKISTIGADTPQHVSRRLTESGDVGLFRLQQLAVTRPIVELVDELNAFQPEVLLPYPTVAGLLALEQIERRLDIKPRVVSTHSEPLTVETRRRIREAWGVDALDHYGLTELSTFAAACKERGSLHALNDLFIAEVVNDDNRPVAAGELGRKVLLTNLYNYTQPIIRYEISDMLVMAAAPCTCGRPFPVIDRIEGRREDCMTLKGLAGGEVVVPPMAVTTLLDQTEGVSEYRISHDRAHMRVEAVARIGAVPGPLAAALETGIRARLRDLGAVPPEISILLVDAIERESRRMGKVKVVHGAHRARECVRTTPS